MTTEIVFPFWEVTKQARKIFNQMLGKSFKVKISKFVRGQLESNQGFGDLERTFYALLSSSFLDSLKNFNQLLIKKIGEFIFRFRAPIGGFFSLHNWNPDVWSTFYAVAALKILGLQLNEDEKKQTIRFLLENRKSDGFFSHCNNKDCLCGTHPTYKSTFFAIACLYLLGSLDVINEIKFSRALLKRIEKNEIDKYYLILTYYLLNPRETLKDDYLLAFITQFQGPDGGFGKKTESTSINDTFWISSCFISFLLSHKLNKGKMLEYISSKYKPDGGFNEDGIQKSDLILTSQAVSIIFLLLPPLYDEVENGILRYVHLQKETYVRTLCDEFFVSEKFVLQLIREMQRKYKWFDIDIIKFKELFNTYVSHLPPDDARIAKKVMDWVFNKTMTKIDLLEFAKTFRRIPDKLEQIKRVINQLIEQHFIIGSIETVKKRLKKTEALRVYILPDNIIVRKREFPYNTIIEEKEELAQFIMEIKDSMDLVPSITQEFEESIRILLDSDEIELAREKNTRNYQQALDKFKAQKEHINNLKGGFFLIDVERSVEILKDWKTRLNQKKDETKKIYANFNIEISERQKILNAYAELEKLVAVINEKLESYKKQIEDLISEFQRTCAKHELDSKKSFFLQQSDDIEANMANTAREINEKISELYNITNKGALLRNVIFTRDSRMGKDIITLNQDIRKKSHAFDEFLASQWNQKQSDSSKRLMDIRSKIYKRDEILNIMDKRNAQFRARLEEMKKIDDDEELNLAILRALDVITETNLYLDEYIMDTNKILDDFDVVAGDIPFLWTDLMERMRLELEAVKKQTEEKILTIKERSKKADFETLIDKKIQKFNRAIDQLEDLSRLEIINEENNLCALIKKRYNFLRSEMKQEDKNINDTIRTESQEVNNFSEYTMVPVNRWKTFMKHIENSLRNKKDYLIETVMMKIIHEYSTEAKGGRVKIDELAKLIGMKKGNIKERLNQMINAAKINAEIVCPNEIIPLTVPNLKQLEFENQIDKYVNEQEFERFEKLFVNYCATHLLDDNKKEISSKIETIFKSLNENDKELESKFSNQFHNPYNEDLVTKWIQRRTFIENGIASINHILDKRHEFKKHVEVALRDIRTQIKDVNNYLSKEIESYSNLDEARTLLDEKFSALDDSIRVHKEKLQDFIESTGTTSYLKKFKIIVEDLQNHFEEEISRFYYEVRVQKEKLEEKFIGILEGDLKEDLRKQIVNFKNEFHDLITEVENTTTDLLSQGNLDEANSTLREAFKDLSYSLRNMGNEIQNRMTYVEKNLKIPNFRDSCLSLLREWNYKELEDVLKRTKIILEDEIIKKNLVYMEKAYETQRIPIQQLASRLGMKRSVMQSRLLRILGTSNLDNIKIDVNSNSIVFGMGRLSYQEIKKALERADLELQEDGIIPETDKSLVTIIYSNFKSFLGFIFAFISPLATLTSLSATFYLLSGSPTSFLIVAIGYPIILVIVTTVLLFYYWIYPKYIKKTKKPLGD